MTDPKQDPKPASPKQHRLLRRLADERGVSFAYPQTSAEARKEIKLLLAQKRQTSRGDRRRETQAVREAMARRGGAAAVRDDEVDGYGSTAHWV
jgi:hypothetical protein